MTVLSSDQWRVLTYMQYHTRRWRSAPKLGEILRGCGFESRRDTLEILQSLQGMGLVSLKLRRVGTSTWAVKTDGAMVGVRP